MNGAFNSAQANTKANEKKGWISMIGGSRAKENSAKHLRAGSRARNICATSQNVISLTGNVSTDDMVRAAKEVNLKWGCQLILTSI